MYQDRPYFRMLVDFIPLNVNALSYSIHSTKNLMSLRHTHTLIHMFIFRYTYTFTYEIIKQTLGIR